MDKHSTLLQKLINYIQKVLSHFLQVLLLSNIFIADVPDKGARVPSLVQYLSVKLEPTRVEHLSGVIPPWVDSCGLYYKCWEYVRNNGRKVKIRSGEMKVILSSENKSVCIYTRDPR